MNFAKRVLRGSAPVSHFGSGVGRGSGARMNYAKRALEGFGACFALLKRTLLLSAPDILGKIVF